MTGTAGSLNILTGKTYSIPETLSDRDNIDAFLQRNTGKKVVVVQGLGFVGAVMSLVVANALHAEYAVIGIDLAAANTYWKIASINEGNFPISTSDEKIDAFFQNALLKGNLYATFDPYAYSVADVVVVDINLDVKKESDADRHLYGYDVSIEGFSSAIASIANHCRENTLVLVETTVPPGTCEKIIRPIFENTFDKRDLPHNFMIGHSYERVMPGPGYVDSIQNFYRVYSGIDERSAVATRDFLETIISTKEYPLTRLKSTTATEMAKVMENSFRAMNIAFIEEWGEFAEEASVDLYEVVNAIRMRATHRNMMLPGLGVGGYCLPKDPLLANWSRTELFNGKRNLPQTETAVRINDRMPYHTFEVVKENAGSLHSKNILLYGLSYLSNVGDSRYTPVEYLYDLFKREGAVITVTDPYISFWEEKRMHVSQDLDSIFANNYDVIICCTNHDVLRNATQWNSFLSAAKETLIIDACCMLSENMIGKLISQKNKVKVIGRGDI